MKAVIFCMALCVSLAGCVMSKDVFTLNYDVKKGGEIGAGDFIELKDGSVIKGDLQKFKLGLGVLNKAGTVTLNNKEYNAKDILVFQVDSNYYRRLPDAKLFVQRIKTGKINLYYQHIRARGMDSRGRPDVSEYDLHYIQKGAKSEIKKFSVKLLSEMIADNATAMSYLQDYKKAKRKEKDRFLDKAIDTYNYE